MARHNRMTEPLRCSFCNKHQHEVRKLIAGPTVFICDECVEVCVNIIVNDETLQTRSETDDDRLRRLASQAFPPKRDIDTCSLCGASQPSLELLPIGDRGRLCGECTNAIEDEIAKGRPIQ